MIKIRRYFLYIWGLPKTILFNFKHLPLRQAVKLPILISHRVWLMDISGTVKISDYRTGSVKIGFGEVGIFDQHRSRTIWQVSGNVEFKGRASIGHGSKISVSGNLIIGKNILITAETSIIAKKSIIIGDDVVISWNTLILDSDLHKIHDPSGNQTNLPNPITIGNKVWIGCRSLILKGINIADGIVVAATSTVNKSFNTPNSMIGGTPAKILRKDVRWKL